MTKWADYVITCVSYTADGSQIATAGVWTDDGQLKNKQTWHRAQVVTALAAGKTFVTAVRTSEGQWKLGAQVLSRTINGARFIQTVANNVEKDNLGSLPKC